MTDEAQKDDRCTGVENGKRVTFEHPSCAGRAALVETPAAITMAYLIAKTGPKPPAAGEAITVEGERFTVLEVKTGKTPPMYRLRLERVAEEA